MQEAVPAFIRCLPFWGRLCLSAWGWLHGKGVGGWNYRWLVRLFYNRQVC